METETNEYNSGLFPIDFALGSCKEVIGLKNHKVQRYFIYKNHSYQPISGKREQKNLREKQANPNHH